MPFILALRQSLISGKVVKPGDAKAPRTAIEPYAVQGKFLLDFLIMVEYSSDLIFAS